MTTAEKNQRTNRTVNTLGVTAASTLFLLVLAPSGFASSENAKEKVGRYDRLIAEQAAEFDVDPALVKAVIRAESAFDPMAVSPRGARGLMQLMPATARRHGAKNLHDPRDNVRAGVRHLRYLLKRYKGDRRLVLAAYNAGVGAVRRYRGLPPHRETRGYVGKVLRFHEEYRRSKRHKPSPALEVRVATLKKNPEPVEPRIFVTDVRPLADCWRPRDLANVCMP